MQRKNYLLKYSYTKRRKGMAMIMAIAIIIILATIMTLSLSLTSQTSKNTTDLYLREQAILLSQSAAEYALLRISQDGPCSHESTGIHFNPHVNTDLDYYDINITLRYSYIGLTCSANDYANSLSREDQNGSVLMDITVSTDEGTEPIRYFRRSIQKL